MKRLVIALFSTGIGLSPPTFAAGIPVIDSANLAQAIQQVTAWGTQAQQMVDQLNQMQKQLENASGVRGMADLVNDPATRQYLPAEYQTLLSDGVGQWEAIQEAAKVFDIEDSSLAGNAEAVASYNADRKQNAINRASAEEAYASASQRFEDIQVLLDKVNSAPDAKDIADLQARIQAEQVMLQNEANKLAALEQLSQAQAAIRNQQSHEKKLSSGYRPQPAGW